MIQSIVRGMGALAIACTVVMAQTQPPAPPSPVIITPPQISPQASAPAQAKVEPDGQPESGKTANGKKDPTAPEGNPGAVGPAYVIGPEDVLFIRVWQQPELSGSVNVGPDGTISLQLIDEVKASGFTPRQLERQLTTRFKEFIKEPEVNVQVLRVNSRTYIIQGDGVNRPGIFPLTRPLNVMEALLAGGGFTPFANKKKIYILRGSQRFNFNWVDVSKGKHLEQNIKIQNGDQIYVP